MKYYAHFGQKDFILCLGYKSAAIKEYFLRYNEAISNDFVMSEGGRSLQLLGTDIQDWTITFADTGLNSNIGQRLKAVERYLHGEEVFLANYADGLTDFPLPSMIDHFMAERKGGGVPLRPTDPQLSRGLAGGGAPGRPASSTCPVRASTSTAATSFSEKRSSTTSATGEELVEEPFHRLVEEGLLAGYRHDGFWLPMDTFKDKQLLEDMYSRGVAPWEVWKNGAVVASVAPEDHGARLGLRTTIRSGCSEAPRPASPTALASIAAC